MDKRADERKDMRLNKWVGWLVDKRIKCQDRRMCVLYGISVWLT